MTPSSSRRTPKESTAAGANGAGKALEAERRGAGLDQLVDLAGAGDLDPRKQVVLLVAARLDAGRARPDLAAALHEVADQLRERLQRVDHRHIGRALRSEEHTS